MHRWCFTWCCHHDIGKCVHNQLSAFCVYMKRMKIYAFWCQGQKSNIFIQRPCTVYLFMAIAVASISTYVYKYVIHRIAISYAAWGAISPKIMEKRYSLLCRLTLYLYLYCFYFVSLYLQSTCVNKMRVRFTILFHLKTMTATTFNTYQV